MFPALDLATYRRRARVLSSYIEEVDTKDPGYVQTSIDDWTSRIYAQLRKRYGGTLPFGRAPSFDVQGTAPPAIALSGLPVLGAFEFVVEITLAGSLGTAQFQWSKDKRRTWSAQNVVTAASLVLTGTGLTATFSPGTYSTDNVYTAPPPIPRCVLGWLRCAVDFDVLSKRGFNGNDDAHANIKAEYQRALAEVEQAANSKDGLFDLPPVDGEKPSNVSTGGMVSYSESGSPFVSADRQERDARFEDEAGFGTFSGVPYIPGGF